MDSQKLSSITQIQRNSSAVDKMFLGNFCLKQDCNMCFIGLVFILSAIL